MLESVRSNSEREWTHSEFGDIPGLDFGLFLYPVFFPEEDWVSVTSVDTWGFGGVFQIPLSNDFSAWCVAPHLRHAELPNLSRLEGLNQKGNRR